MIVGLFALTYVRASASRLRIGNEEVTDHRVTEDTKREFTATEGVGKFKQDSRIKKKN